MPKLRKSARWFTGAVAPMAVVLCGCVPVYLTRDLETRTQGAFPTEFTEAGDGMYFVATHPIVGRELVYIPNLDTLQGNLVGDLNPGSGFSTPGGIYTRNTRAFFYADDNSDGNTSAAQYSLFVTDGPENTTVRLTAPGSSLPSQVFSPFGNYGADGVLFLRSEATTGVEIWRSNGTVGGTQIVQDLRPGTIGSSPQDMTSFSGFYYFSAAGSDGQRELWRTDGNTTTLVKDINPSGQSQPRDFVVFNGSLYFGADQGATFLRGLFKTNGDAQIDAGDTVLVTDRSGDASFRPEPMAATATGIPANNRMFLMAYYQELWVSDGTAGGTTFLYDFEPNGEGEVAQSFVTLGARVLFHVPTDDGRQLWASDGTVGGTVFLADNVDTGDTATIMGSFYYYIVGDALYRTNGTVAGTTLVYSQAGLSPLSLRNVNGTLYFWGNDTNVGGEMWSSDGTPGGTQLVGDFNTATEGSDPSTFVKAGAYTYFTATVRGTGRELYRTDGTEGGTVLVKDINPGTGDSTPTLLVAYNGLLYFKANDGTNGAEIWRSDGTSNGTFMVKNIHPSAANQGPFDLYAGPNYLYFYADDGVNGAELWRSDGTNPGTVMVQDINPGIAASTPRWFATLGSKVCFWATRAAEGREPWCSDGTSGGTAMVRDIRTGTSSSDNGNVFASVGGHLYFAATDGIDGTELWRTDGTSGGTTRRTQINAAANGSSSPQRFAVMNGGVFYTAFDGTRWEMWRTDSTTTTMITGALYPSSYSNPDKATAVGNTLFFIARTTTTDYELYKTDGTAAGVQLVKDVRTGTGSAGINYMTAVGNRVYFSANDGVNGTELWTSDGTKTEIVTGEGDGRSSSPLHLAAAGNRLYFNMNDPELGTEAFYSEP